MRTHSSTAKMLATGCAVLAGAPPRAAQKVAAAGLRLPGAQDFLPNHYFLIFGPKGEG